MKRILILLLAAMSICSCSKFLIIDWVPVTFKISVQDGQGKDLLDPVNDNTWLIGTRIHFNGRTADIDETGISAPETKALPGIYHGVRLEKGADYYYLAFGEFDGGTEYDKEEMVIEWPDGSINRITYTRKLNHVKVSAKQTFKLDGEKCSNPIVIKK